MKRPNAISFSDEYDNSITLDLHGGMVVIVSTQWDIAGAASVATLRFVPSDARDLANSVFELCRRSGAPYAEPDEQEGGAR
jgi:hypothetical protein